MRYVEKVEIWREKDRSKTEQSNLCVWDWGLFYGRGSKISGRFQLKLVEAIHSSISIPLQKLCASHNSYSRLQGIYAKERHLLTIGRTTLSKERAKYAYNLLLLIKYLITYDGTVIYPRWTTRVANPWEVLHSRSLWNWEVIKGWDKSHVASFVTSGRMPALYSVGELLC
jgi:hypothetical protein